MEHRDLLLISDLHLGSHLKPRTRGEYVHLAAEIERSFPQFIDHYMQRGRWQLVVNGDFIDFWNVEIDIKEGDAEALAVARLHAVLNDHPAVEDAMMRFLEAGNGVVFVAGNHDAEFLYPKVRRALASRLESGISPGTSSSELSITRTGVQVLRRMEAGRVRFVPWFIHEPSGVWIEHGHLFDPACSTNAPLAPTRGGRLVQTVAEVATRSFANLMPEMDYHAPDSWTVLDYIRWAAGRGLRFVVRVVYLYLGMVGRMLALWVRYGRPDKEGRENHEARLSRMAANAGLRMGTLAALEQMAPPPTAVRIGGVLSVTAMDYVLAAVGGLISGVVLAIAVGQPLGWGVLGGVALAAAGVWSVRRNKRARDVGGDMLKVASEVARVTEVPLVLMGHSHHGELVDVGTALYANSGSWLDGFHLTAHRDADGRLARVDLRRWRNGSVCVEQSRKIPEALLNNGSPAPPPEVSGVLAGR